jgi:hypothetical protein
MSGVASAHGSHVTNSVANMNGQGCSFPSACMISTVWLASNKPPMSQMAAIQNQGVAREPEGSVMVITLRQEVL